MSANGFQPSNGMAAVAPDDWAMFPCHSIADGKCTCGRADCHSPGKHPRTPNGLLDATNNAAELTNWWTAWPQANLAIATGEGNGIAVIDIDPAKGGTDSMREIEEQHGQLPETVEVETGGGGLHLYFRYPTGAKVHSRNGWRPGVDIKADGGYVIAPPSNHVSGGNYRWAEGRAPGEIEIAQIPPWLLALLPRKDQQPQNTHHVAPSPNGHDSLLQRAQSYVAKAAAVGEGQRDDAAFRLAGHVAAFGLSDSEIVSVLGPWNLRNSPPLSEGELRKCVASAMKNGEPRPAKETSSRAAQHYEHNGERLPPPKPLDKFTFAELRAAYPRLNPPIIDGLFREGETCNVISTSKIGKSWLGYGMILSVTTGRPWLGRFGTSPGKVLLVDNELHRPTLADRIPKVADAMQIQAEHYESDLIVMPLRGNLRSLANLEDEFDEIEAGTFKLILLDAMYRFAIDGVSENDNAAMATMYNTLDRIAERTKAAIVLIHHTTKGSQTEKRVTDVGAGAGAQSRAADCHLILREHEEAGVFVLEAAVRSFAPVEPMSLRWTFPLWHPADDIDPALLKGRLKPSEQRQNEKDREGVEKIIKGIQARKALPDGHATARALREITGIGKDRQQRLLDWMVSEGHATATKIVVRGNPTREYSLPKSEE